MNNFKKLLASAMALTMVTSVLPVNHTEVNAASDSTCDTADGLYDAIMDVADEDGLNDVDFFGEHAPEVQWNGQKFSSIYEFIGGDGEREQYESTNLDTIAAYYEGSRPCTSDETLQANAQYIVNAYTAIKVLKSDYGMNQELAKEIEEPSSSMGLLEIVEKRLDSGYSTDRMEANHEYYYEAQAILTYLDEVYDSFSGNLDQDTLERLVRLSEDLERNISDVNPDWEFEGLEDYIELVEENIEKFVAYETDDDKDSDDRKSIVKSEVDLFLRALKNNSVYKKTDITFENGRYNVYKDNEDVVALVESVEDMYDSIEQVEEVTNSRRFEAYSDFLATKKAGKYDGVLENLVDKMKLADFEVYETFKEEVVDVVYTFEAREYTNYYTNRSAKSAFISESGMNSVMEDFGTELFDLDRETGEFGWDVLAAHMADVEANYNALTEGLEGIDAINVAVDDREAILAADDALYFFGDGDSSATGNLTTAQRREVRDAVRKVEELLEAYRSKFGTVGTTTGWVDMGNGNWNYYEADGTAPTKWICSAPNTWYYVQNGNMLRNAWVWRDADSAYYVGDDGVMVYGPTTVNGYELDANGLWHR